MKLSHYTVRARLRFGFAVALVLLLIVAGTGLYELSRANAETAHIVRINLVKIGLLEEMSDSVHVVSRVVRSMALLPDPARAEVERLKIAAAREKYDRAFAALRAMPLDQAGQDFVRELNRFHDDVRPMNNRFIEMTAQGDSKAIYYLLDVAGPATNKWQETLRAFMTLQKKKSDVDAERAERAFERASNLMLGLSFLAVVISAFFAVQITRSIVVPLNNAIGLAHKVASGDLTAMSVVHPKDKTETGSLLRALNEMTAGLNRIVAQVREGAHTLSTHAAEIAQGNMDLSGRTEQQASTLEETAAAMEELTSTVQNNSGNARTANSLAANTAQIAVHGGEVVDRVVEVMAGLDASSSRIVDIIDVIEGIAFQTNILALNAAVEAARAGEQGRGFAVVASEVRTLAQRSGTAAHEIKDLIHRSVNQIKEGNELVSDAGTTMRDIVSGITKVSTLVAEIATASQEQAVGIEQTYQTTSELDHINQQNTALVEEIAASAGSLKDEAVTLERTVANFKLKEAQLPRAASQGTQLSSIPGLPVVALQY